LEKKDCLALRIDFQGKVGRCVFLIIDNGSAGLLFNKNGFSLSSVIVSFPLEEDPNVLMVAWTTTPWTLPSNLALCVHPDLDYVKVQGEFCCKLHLCLEMQLYKQLNIESACSVKIK
jgi:hypothetical protein